MQRAERGSWLANGKRGYGDKEGRTKYVEIGCRYQTYLQPFDAFPGSACVSTFHHTLRPTHPFHPHDPPESSLSYPPAVC